MNLNGGLGARRISSFAELRVKAQEQQDALKNKTTPVISSPLMRAPTLTETVSPQGEPAQSTAEAPRIMSPLRSEAVSAEPVMAAETTTEDVVVPASESEPVVAEEAPVAAPEVAPDISVTPVEVPEAAEVVDAEKEVETETEGVTFETLVASAYQVDAPEFSRAAEQLALSLTGRLDRHAYYLDRLRIAAEGNARRQREVEMFQARAELQTSLGDSVRSFLYMLAGSTGEALPKPEVLATQRKIATELAGYLEKDSERIAARLSEWESSEPVKKGELIAPKEVAEVPPVAEATPEELPKGPEDVAYESLTGDWKTIRETYEEGERSYHEALRAELAAQAKSWNPLKSIPYAARKMFGFNQKLSGELEKRKTESTANAILYRDASNALAVAKRDALMHKFEGVAAPEEKMQTLLQRHERMLGRKLVLSRAKEQLAAMQEAPSLAEHPRMQKALEVLQNNKWKVMAGSVGIAALTGGLLPVLAALGTGVAVRAGLGEKIKSLLERSKNRASAENVTAQWRERLGYLSYDELLATAERALEKVAMAEKHASYTNLAAFGAAAVAGGAFAGAGPNLADYAEHMPLENSVQAVVAPEAPVTLPTPEVSAPAEIVLAPEAVATPEYVPTAPVEVAEVPPVEVAPAVAPLPEPVHMEAQEVPSASSEIEVAPAPVPESVVTTEYGVPVQAEGGYLTTAGAGEEVANSVPVAEAMPVAPQPALEGTPLSPAVAETIKNIETFNVEKPGFLGMFSSNELQTTGGEVYATMKDLTLDDIAKIYQDPVTRAEVFPNGVSPESLERWVTWIQEHNTQETPAYVNLKLEDFVTTVHRAH